MRYALATILLAAVATGGCTLFAGNQQATRPSGTIAGQVLAVGGPAPGTARPMADELVIVTGHDANGTRIRIGAKTNSSGRFRISLPCGRYTVRTLGERARRADRVQVSPRGLARVRLIQDIR